MAPYRWSWSLPVCALNSSTFLSWVVGLTLCPCDNIRSFWRSTATSSTASASTMQTRCCQPSGRPAASVCFPRSWTLPNNLFLSHTATSSLHRLPLKPRLRCFPDKRTSCCFTKAMLEASCGLSRCNRGAGACSGAIEGPLCPRPPAVGGCVTAWCSPDQTWAFLSAELLRWRTSIHGCFWSGLLRPDV